MAPITRTGGEPNTPQYQAHLDTSNRAEARTKRMKLQHSSSPERSTVSDDSAMIPTSVPGDTTDASDVDSDVSSEVSESSEDPSDESDEEEDEDRDMEDPDEEGVVNLRANRGKKPVMKLEAEEMEDIRPFLKDFLPKLKAANEELEAQKQAGTLETAEIIDEDTKDDVDAEEQYIELVSAWLPLASAIGEKGASRLLFALQE
jgi:hypothetical protein